MCNFAELTFAATSILRVFEEFEKKSSAKIRFAKIYPFKVYKSFGDCFRLSSSKKKIGAFSQSKQANNCQMSFFLVFIRKKIKTNLRSAAKL